MAGADTLIVNAGALLTMVPQTRRPTSSGDATSLGIIRDGAVAIADGVVLETGTTEELTARFPSCGQVYDAGDRLVMPGFVDCHTHAVFAGTREAEMVRRLGGASYLDILKSGGGIHQSVEDTRRATEEALVLKGIERLDQMAAHGTTTVEIKSGYGLEEETEKKMLNAIRKIGERHPLDVVSTYLSAHAVPRDSRQEAYIDWIEESLEEFVGLAEFFDVFCEDGAFTLDETVRLLTAAKAAGFKLKAHAGQFSDKGAAGAAAGLGSVSCDHLEKISDDQMAAMKRSGTAAVLLPGVPFFLGTGEYPDGRRLLEAGLRVALATDFNPGSCPCFSMQMIIALAVFECGMSVSEALAAATVNGALALDRGGISGCLAPGFQADIAVLDVETPEQIAYHFGGNLVSCVFKNGERIFEGSKVKRSGDEF